MAMKYLGCRSHKPANVALCIWPWLLGLDWVLRPSSVRSLIVLKWLKEDLAARGPRNAARGNQAKTYDSSGIGGYGYEKANK